MKKYIIGILIIIVIIAGISTYFLVRNKDNDESGIATIRLNEVTRSVFYSPQYIAISNGYFEEENLDIEITTGQGADKVMTAVLSGQSDIGFARTRSGYICL